MLTAIITDQHFGCRKNSDLFHNYFLQFYEIFFKNKEDNKIKTIIDLGDTFDHRKNIDFAALDWAKKNYYDRLRDLDCTVYTVVGNHTAYYKNTNSVNAVDLLLREYNNVKVISEPTELLIGGLPILFIPWINQENEYDTLMAIKKTKASVVMGHLEISGFQAYKGHVMEDGRDKNIFKKFDIVFSGHYHTRSNNGKIFYLGNPYEMYWNDLNDERGFHLFDTKNLFLDPINNPYKMFYQIEYHDGIEVDFDEYKNKIIKVIVKQKTNVAEFDDFINALYKADAAEVKIVENFNTEAPPIFEELESEHTISIVNKYIQESTMDLEKSKINRIFEEVYKEACEMI